MRKIGLASIALAAAIACSNNSGNGDAGSDSGSEAAGNTYTQTGQIAAFGGGGGLGDIVVSGAGNSVTTDDKGNYTLAVPQKTAYTMQVVAAPDASTSYVSLDEQEWMLLGNADRGKTSFVSNQTENLLKAVLPVPPDMNLAVLSVIVEGTAPDGGGCDVTGATISVPGLPSPDAGGDAGGGPVLVYFSGGFPSGSATSVTAGQLPSALVYNLPPTASFNQITVTHPTCKQVAFPVADPTEPNIQYTGNVKLEASMPTNGPQVVSNIRIFLQ